MFSSPRPFLPPLSTHILFYVYNLKVPNLEINKVHKFMTPIAITEPVLQRSLAGPTNDLEDNLQLHSAIEVGARFF